MCVYVCVCVYAYVCVLLLCLIVHVIESYIMGRDVI